MVGTGVGAACSVPITNVLLSAQIISNEKAQENVTSGFGGFMQNVRSDAQSYISEVSYSTDIAVVLRLAGVGVLLTLISSLLTFL